jgi:membrane protein implicated in regulation of membrane protease activity
VKGALLCGFWNDFGSNLAASLVAGVVLLYLTYRYVENRLRLRERAQREADEAEERVQRREAVLTAVLAELEDSAARVGEWLQVLPKTHIPSPGLDTTGWPLIVQVSIFTTLSSKTIQALTHVYNRMRTTNEHLATLTDLNHGPTAILVNSVLADPAARKVPLAQEAFDAFFDHRESVREMLIERVENLKASIATAIDAVEAELERPGTVPAAERHFVHEDPSLLRQLAEIEGESAPGDESPPP